MKRINKIPMILVLVFLAVFVICFPIKYAAGHTCLADYLTSHGPHPLSFGAMRARYVFPFGLIWWASIGVLFWGFFKLQNKKQGE